VLNPTQIRLNLLVIILLLLATSSTWTLATETVSARQPPPPSGLTLPGEEPTNQIIIKFKPEAGLNKLDRQQQDTRLRNLSVRAGVQLTYAREMSDNAEVLRLPEKLPLAEVEAIAAKLNTDQTVLYAEPDAVMRPMDTPNDPEYINQWHYQEVSGGNYGANLPGAWDITHGSSSLVIAVIDSGILFNHPDLNSRTVAGYDFIADVPTANDGNGRDNNAADPGNWVTVAESTTPGGPLEGCAVTDSSWHGTHVAGTIGAASDNAAGVAGINWNSKILPVRALGKCGGFTSDIVDGIRWAAGLAVPGVPNNANRARVLNLSLGGGGTCGSTFQNAINQIRAINGIVVVAAGNSDFNAGFFTPANCNGVITVAATGPTGDKAGYSNFGSVVEISAPGGDQDLGTTAGVLSTLNDGTTGPANHIYVFYQGTSMAAPHVAGIISLMLSVNPVLGSDFAVQILQQTSTPFPSGSTCSTSICGRGIVNAAAAVQLTLNLKKVYLPVVRK
jgi:serine protease